MTKTTKTKAEPVTLLERAWAAVPELAALDAVLPELRARHRATLTMPVPGDADVVSAMLDELAAGAPVPDRFGDRLVEARAARDAAAAERAAIEGVLRAHSARRRRAQHDGADEALAVVGDELADIVTAARPVFAELDGIGSADAAIAAGAKTPDAWRQAVDLASRRHEVREAQLAIVSAALHPVDEPARPSQAITALVERYGLLRGVETFPLTAAERPRPVMTVRQVGGRIQEVSQSERAERPAGAFPTGDLLEDLRIEATGDVEPWVPSIGELRDAERAAVAAAAEAGEAWDEEEHGGTVVRRTRSRTGRAPDALRLASGDIEGHARMAVARS